MRTFTGIAAATVLAGGLTVAGAGTALADPHKEGIIGHVLSDLLGSHVPNADSLQGGSEPSPSEAPASPAEEAPADTGAEQDTPGDTTAPGQTMTPGEEAPAADTGDTVP